MTPHHGDATPVFLLYATQEPVELAQIPPAFQTVVYGQEKQGNKARWRLGTTAVRAGVVQLPTGRWFNPIDRVFAAAWSVQAIRMPLPLVGLHGSLRA